MKFLSAFLLLLASVCAFGQRDAFDYHVADVAILQSKPVQKDIGITEAQRARMNVAATKYSTEMRAYQTELQGQKNPKVDPARVLRYQQALKESVIAQMTVPQLKRLRELTLQYQQVIALTDSTVASRVGLSPAQLKRVRSTFQEGTQAIGLLSRKSQSAIMSKYQGLKPKSQAEQQALGKQYSEEMMAAAKRLDPQLKAIAHRNTAKIMAILTPAEKATWKSLQGREFVFPGH